MAIGVDIFLIDDELVKAVGDILQAVYLQMSGIFGSFGFGGEMKLRNLTPNPFP